MNWKSILQFLINDIQLFRSFSFLTILYQFDSSLKDVGWIEKVLSSKTWSLFGGPSFKAGTPVCFCSHSLPLQHLCRCKLVDNRRTRRVVHFLDCWEKLGCDGSSKFRSISLIQSHHHSLPPSVLHLLLLFPPTWRCAKTHERAVRRRKTQP